MTQSNTSVVATNKGASLAISAILVALALLSIVFILQENGLLLSSEAAGYLHEATHDARHALGVPCH